MANWYYARDGEQQGPVTLDALRDVVARRVIGPTDLVWSEGMPEWVEAGTVSALSPTPGDVASMFLIRAWACGLLNTRAYNMPRISISAVNAGLPCTSLMASTFFSGLPTV